MLLNALPPQLRAEVLANRATGSVDLIYAVLTHYQLGGLLEGLRGWRRSLRRAEELDIATPDPTLLMAALDRMAEVLTKSSAQTTFRLSSTRAALLVDVSPNLKTVLNFSDALLAEAESAFLERTHASISPAAPVPPLGKVKALIQSPEEKGEKSAGKTKTEGTTKEEKVCKFWGSEDGCRRGGDCTFKHDCMGQHRQARPMLGLLFSTKHTKKECTAGKMAKIRD